LRTRSRESVNNIQSTNQSLPTQLTRMSICFRQQLTIRFFFSSRRRHTRSVSAFLLNRSSDLRNRRQLNSLQNTWPYGYSMPIAVRYTQDAFSRSGWLWPVDAKGEPLKATSYMAVGFYVAKYVNKKSDMDLAAKGLG